MCGTKQGAYLALGVRRRFKFEVDVVFNELLSTADQVHVLSFAFSISDR